MKRLQTSAGAVGILFLIIFTIAIAALIFLYGKNFTHPDAKIGELVPQDISKLSDDLVVKAMSTLLGFEFTKNQDTELYEAHSVEGYSSFTINQIVMGDLNKDGNQDAVVWSTACGVSCSSVFHIVLNGQEAGVEVFETNPEDMIISGAAQYIIKDISIDEGIVTMDVEIPHENGSTDSTLLHYRLSGKDLLKQ